MTYILGSKIKSFGAILIGDRKILSIDGNSVDYDEKLFFDFPIVMGFSGMLDVAKRFRADLQDYIKNNKINSINFVSKTEDIANNIKKRYRSYENFEAIICLQIRGDKPSANIYHLHDSSYHVPILEEVNKYIVIGSGEYYGRAFLKQLWRKDMWPKEIIELGYFIIRYIEKFELDPSVGIGIEKPQVWAIPNFGANIYETKFEIDIANKTENRLEYYKRCIDNIWDSLKVQMPIK